MRVVQVIPTLGVGGAEKVVVLLAQELARLGHDVAVAVLGGRQGTWLEEAAEEVGPVHFLDKGPGLDLRIVPRLRRVLRPADVVHTHLHVLKYLWPRWRGPTVHTVHNLAEREAEAHDRKVQQLAFRTGVTPVAIGQAVAASVQRVYGRSGPVIPNGIPLGDLAVHEGARDAVRAELGVEGALLLAVGRLDEQKDHATMFRAVDGLDATLVVAGDGPLRDELDPPPSVRLLGVRKDVPRLLAACDLFVLSSRWEGNPLSVMEAMGAGRPVVATSVGCVPELVVEGAGRLVEAGDADGLRRAISTLLADPDALRAAGEVAVAHARAHFDVPVMARAYAELYAELCSGNGARW